VRHDAAAAGDRLEGSTSSRIRLPSSATLLLVLAAEVLLLALTWRTGKPWVPVALALAPAFFLLAFRSPDLAWALVWIAVPFSMQALLPGGNAVQFPTEPMIAIALAAWAARWLATPGYSLSSSRLHLPLAVMAGVALLSTLAGSHAWIGIKAWVVAAGYAAFGYLYFVNASCDPARRERWIRLTVATGAAFGLYGFVRVLVLGVSARTAYGVARPFFAEHGTYSAYLAMLLPLALFAALERGGRARWMYGLATLAISLGVVFSFTRAAWVSLAIVLPIATGAWIARRRSVRALLVPGLVLAATAVVLVGAGAVDPFSQHAQSVTDPENVSNLERLNRWLAAVEMTRDRPVLGVGYGAYPASYQGYRRKLVVTELAYAYMGAHSEPLRLLSETGITGFGVALWLLGTAAWIGIRAFRNGSPSTSWIALALVAGLATYTIHGIFNAYLAIDKAAVPFWMGLGAIASLSRAAEREPSCAS
jgi:O-antigen ligase